MDATRESEMFEKGISSYIEKLTKIFPVRIFKNRKK